MAQRSFLSGTQQTVSEFMEASKDLRAVANDPNFPELAEFTDHFLSAVTHFGRTEMELQGVERVADLTKGGFAPRDLEGFRATRLQLADRFNRTGIRLLEGADRLPETVARLEPPNRAALQEDVSALKEELQFHLGELEVKPSDSSRIAKAISPIFDLVGQGNVNGLYEHVARQAGTLQRLRASESRGAEENIPVWKIVAIAVAVGVWVWALFKCKWWGSCSLKEGLAYAIIFWISAFIAKFC
jgi:hypothetical protein